MRDAREVLLQFYLCLHVTVTFVINDNGLINGFSAYQVFITIKHFVRKLLCYFEFTATFSSAVGNIMQRPKRKRALESVQ